MSRTAAEQAEHQLSLYLDHIVALVGDGFREEAKSVIVANEARAANRVAEAMREAVLSICREWSANGFLQARLVARDVRDLPLPDPPPDPSEATIARLSVELEAVKGDNERLILDIEKNCDPVTHCEGCGAPLFVDEDWVSSDDCSGCWYALTDAESKDERTCFAYRVGKPDAHAVLAKLSKGE